jgi:hypothetical protein
MVGGIALDLFAIVDNPDAADTGRGYYWPSQDDQSDGDGSNAHVATVRDIHCRAERTDGYVEDPKNRRSEGETKSDSENNKPGWRHRASRTPDVGGRRRRPSAGQQAVRQSQMQTARVQVPLASAIL